MKKVEEISVKPLQDSVTKNSFLLALAIWLVSVIGLAWVYQQIPPVTPLFYSLVSGESQLVDKPFLALLPSLSIIFILIHWALAKFNIYADYMFARILGVSALLSTLLFSIALFKIINIVL